MISICILNWNCLKTLEQTIRLIANDLIDINYEVIIYDQNSNDGSIEFLRSIKSDRIKPIFGAENVGNSVSRNIMINQAQYKYILLLDSDIIPIKYSIKSMIAFMESHLQYAYIGYNWKSYTTNIDNITAEETGIKETDIDPWRCTLALSQYGIFRKEVLSQFKFPEFYPFNLPGWGAEDDILGQVIFNSEVGAGGVINGRIYFHNKSSSINLLGKDTHKRMFMKRIISFLYFKKLLNKEQQIAALKQQALPHTYLKCNKYFWDNQKNLGDVATDFLLQKYFPFLHFDSNNKENLLMFGGTVFNHIENANIKYNANYKNILYFGVGLSKLAEISHANSMIQNRGVECTIVPRGPKSETEFKKHGFRCEAPCGDVLQIFATMEKANHNIDDPELLVHDVYHPHLLEPKKHNFITIKVADNGLFSDIPYYDLEKFLSAINNYSKVYSSQVHPVFIAGLLGKPCHLHPKDWRILDFKYFNHFNYSMDLSLSEQFRSDAQNNIVKFCHQFYDSLKMFI